jgi:hypothetical protein
MRQSCALALVASLAVGQGAYAMSDEEVRVAMQLKGPPQSRLAAFGGTLLGFDQGEWGGALVFVDSDARPIKLLERNVQGIVETWSGIFVFTGLAHLFENSGELYRIVELSKNVVKPELQSKLPGAPRSVKKLVNGASFMVYTGRYELRPGYPLNARSTQNVMPVLKCFHLSGDLVREDPYCEARR